jgi:hypothetical protein
MPMSVVTFIVLILLIAGLWYFVSIQGWVTPFFKNVIFFVLGFLAIVILLTALGVMDELRSMRMPHVSLEVHRTLA